MNTAILHANLKEIGRFLLVVKTKSETDRFVRMWNLSDKAYYWLQLSSH